MKKNYKLLPMNYGEAEARLAAVEHYINDRDYPDKDAILSLLGFVEDDPENDDLKVKLAEAMSAIESLQDVNRKLEAMIKETTAYAVDNFAEEACHAGN